MSYQKKKRPKTRAGGDYLEAKVCYYYSPKEERVRGKEQDRQGYNNYCTGKLEISDECPHTESN